MLDPTRRTAPPGHRDRAEFRPRFMLVVLYLAGFYLLFGMLFALPDLLEAARHLPPGPEQLSPEELNRAKAIAREAMQGGRVMIAFAAAGLAVAVGVWTRALPGLR